MAVKWLAASRFSVVAGIQDGGEGLGSFVQPFGFHVGSYCAAFARTSAAR